MKNYFCYWGKADKSDDSDIFHLLPYHSLDVAAIGWELFDENSHWCKELAEFLSVNPVQLRHLITFTLALHDLGKFSGAFQSLKTFESHQCEALKTTLDYNSGSGRHDKLGHYFWHCFEQQEAFQSVLNTNGVEVSQKNFARTLKIIIGVSLGHHGKPVNIGSNEILALQKYCHNQNTLDAWDFVSDAAALFQPCWPAHWFTDKQRQQNLKQISWHLAGIAVIADWLGSNSKLFTYRSDVMPLSEYWLQAKKQAKKAIAQTDLFKSYMPRPFHSIKDQFGFDSTPLQRWSESVDLGQGPQLFILEDVTGSGKTEAALALTHRLMANGQADGFYFGLPSMATSNAMYQRIADHYHSMYQDEQRPPSLVLAHSAREMNDGFRQSVMTENSDSDYSKGDASTSATCNQWLADSRKKALLAPVGVGTLDQALLAVLPQKHQALRMVGLHRKILIFDEVHAADEFMLVLLKDLMALHVRQGGSVILLTATLSNVQRQALVNTWQQALQVEESSLNDQSFPLATQVNINGASATPLTSRKEVSREVGVSFVHTFDDCVTKVLDEAKAGRSVVWVRNSVDDARAAYQAISDHVGDHERCLLFHSRFVLADRKRIEDRVLKHLGKRSTHQDRNGFIVISTQVFQESLDADADVMLTDICPIDDLIQRAGRLHRHTRNQQGVVEQGIKDGRAKPELTIYAPEWSAEPGINWLKQDFPNTEAVYRSPAKLWLGMRILKQLGAIRMPEQARDLIEAVYGNGANNHIPDALFGADAIAKSEGRHKHTQANQQTINWGKGYCTGSAKQWLDDEVEISTRYSEYETVEVVVLSRDENQQLVPLVQDNQFAIQLSTLKLAKIKFADKLHQLSEDDEQQFKARHPQSRYKQLWLAEDDESYRYSATKGFQS
ncbi:CRISPR-associated helicase Cas3' [Photobacterium sp.]|uniref:CRISPR-associated helicase Cas3' n=1 Tax=Photobacterium sp. TaxID=660 RepID=UPI00299EE180|nr:CRISPR-associated helicase Cas3' [Photobacterium sp.]MDX1300832.1 CRISPR-associated helicase Cas3' [Photobacterium sp.]